MTPSRTALSSLALALCAMSAQAQTFSTTTPVPALVPDAAGGSDGAVCASPGWTEFQIPVSGVTAPITGISVTLGLNIAWAGDATATLISPLGVQHVLFGRIGKTTTSGLGFPSHFNGVYEFVDPAVSNNNIWTAAAGGSSVTIAPGRYATTQMGSDTTPDPAPTTAFNAHYTALSPGNIVGTWILRVVDCSPADRVTVNAAAINLTSGTAPELSGLAPDGTVGQPYSFTPTLAPGAAQPVTFSLAPASTLPPGLALDPATGTISGTPTMAGGYGFILWATNIVGTVTAFHDIVIAAAPVAAPQAVPTLGEWALMLMGALAAGLGMRRLGRKNY